MNIKKTLSLLFLPLFILALGCSFTPRNRATGHIAKGISSGHPYEMGQAYQKQHEDSFAKAIRHFREALEDPQTGDQARFELGMLFYETGDYEKAIQHLERAKDDGPNRFLVSKILGLSHFRLHQHAQALQHLKKAHALSPKDGEVLYSLGLIYEQENFAEEAKGCFRKVIRVSRWSSWAKQAKAHLQTLQSGDTGITLSKIKDKEVRRLIQKAPGQEDYPDAGAVILLDQEKLIISADMTQSREIHKVIKILNDRGKWRAEVKVHYNSLEETVRVDLARTIRPNGTIVNVGKEAMRDLTPWSGFSLYSNAKTRVISMPAVENGSIIEYRATITSSALNFDRHFADSFRFRDYEPTIVSRFMLEIPEGLHFKTHFVHTDPIEPRIERLDIQKAYNRKEATVRYTWEMRGLPAIKWERRMPGWVDISPIILVSSFPDWGEFNRWLWGLAKDRMGSDRAIRRKVLELTKGEETPEERASSLFHYVASEIRYVGLEYGRGGYRPHHAKKVYANKYGDCKDQAILLVTMLREAGIRAYPVLIGTRKGMWELQRSIPMSQFDHCIAVAEVNGRKVWLDPTDETCSFGDLPGYDQGREVLVFFENGARFLKTPVLPPARNKHVNEMEIGINANGGIDVNGKHTFWGWGGRALRGQMKWRDPRERIDLMKELVSEGCPGAMLEGCIFSPLDDLNVPPSVEYQVSAHDYVKRAGDMLLFRIPWFSNETYHVAKEERTHPLTWGETESEEERISIRIPEGYRVRYLPESFEINLPFASYRLEYANSGGRIVLRTLKVRSVRTIGVDQYPDYKKYEERISKELDKLIILERRDGLWGDRALLGSS